jgi:high-affinity Fe2+/Pb2+ permease
MSGPSVFARLGQHAGSHPIAVVLADAMCAGILGFVVGMGGGALSFDPERGYIAGLLLAAAGAVLGLSSVHRARRNARRQAIGVTDLPAP